MRNRGATPDRAREVKRARNIQLREAHEQNIKLSDAHQPVPFTHTQFVAFVEPTSIKFDKYGTMSVTFHLPPEFRDRGWDMVNAGGILLSVDVEVWDEALVPNKDEDDPTLDDISIILR